MTLGRHSRVVAANDHMSRLHSRGNRFACRMGAASILFSASASSQALVSLKPPLATVARDLGRISAVRELSDGRVLTIDATERRLLVVDLATQRVEVVGRNGQGPGEYVRPITLHAVGSDSTIVEDGGSRRWLVLSG